MSRFTSIDPKLEILAKQLNGKLTTNRHEKMPMPNGYEERRIDWKHNDLNLAIQIFPTIKHWNDKLNKWNFGSWAWKDLDGERYINRSINMKDVELSKILLSIDNLLAEAAERLNRLTFDDLTSQAELYGK